MKTQNSRLGRKLAEVPYSERLVLLPQCLRSNQCKAPRGKFGLLECQGCRQKREDGLECPIPTMVEIAYEIGYGGVYVFTGGSGIVSFLKEIGLPGAVLGVACEPEIIEGRKKMDELGIPNQVEYLVEAGCAETILFRDPNNFKIEWLQILTKFSPDS